MIVLDTHVVIWWVSDPEKLPRKIRELIQDEREKGEVLISSISIWEVYMLVKKGRLGLIIDTDSWMKELQSVPNLTFIPVDNQIAAKAVTLPKEFHEDPADRMIVATAREYGATLITKDEKIRNYHLVKTLW